MWVFWLFLEFMMIIVGMPNKGQPHTVLQASLHVALFWAFGSAKLFGCHPAPMVLWRHSHHVVFESFD